VSVSVSVSVSVFVSVCVSVSVMTTGQGRFLCGAIVCLCQSARPNQSCMFPYNQSFMFPYR